MQRYNPRNERIKKEYFRYLKEADRKSDSTIDEVRKALARFEDYTGRKDFSTFHREQAIAFKKHLATTKSIRSGKPLAKSTMHATVNALKSFFSWLSFQQGYKSRIRRTDIEYFNLSEKDVRAAKQPAVKQFPTLEQIRKTVFAMPASSQIERRDRAIVAFAIVTGMRDNAIASIRLKHIDIDRELVIQDSGEVRTKFSKRIITYFFPVGDDLKDLVKEWARELREDMLFGNDDPVFPRTRIGHDENRSFAVDGLDAECWSTAEPIRKIFRRAFAGAGLSYFKPHSFRDTLSLIGKQRCRTMEEFEAWSRNLGHAHTATTFRSYGGMDPHRQGQVIKALEQEQTESDKLDRIMEMMRKLDKYDPGNSEAA